MSDAEIFWDGADVAGVEADGRSVTFSRLIVFVCAAPFVPWLFVVPFCKP